MKESAASDNSSLRKALRRRWFPLWKIDGYIFREFMIKYTILLLVFIILFVLNDIYRDISDFFDAKADWREVVMYAGRVIEKGTAHDIFHNPLHPYTIGLQKSKPMINSDVTEPLYSIPGQVPNPINLPNSCYFKGRCDRCVAQCEGDYPAGIQVSDTHWVSCYLYEEKADPS